MNMKDACIRMLGFTSLFRMLCILSSSVSAGRREKPPTFKEHDSQASRLQRSNESAPTGGDSEHIMQFCSAAREGPAVNMDRVNNLMLQLQRTAMDGLIRNRELQQIRQSEVSSESFRNYSSQILAGTQELIDSFKQEPVAGAFPSTSGESQFGSNSDRKK